MLRTLNAVVDEGALCFHGAPVGEKMEALGRTAVVCAEEIVASIPSYFLDPERACPATTLYRSAQAHGILTEVTSPERKARVLAALMAKYQPEGKHVPITADHPSTRRPSAASSSPRSASTRSTARPSSPRTARPPSASASARSSGSAATPATPRRSSASSKRALSPAA
ncbi:MAG: pyridoxamine 5'-phosphate oxidase family protein [Polyangiaceae bacterium]